MESLDTSSVFIDDLLLDFSSDLAEEDDDDNTNNRYLLHQQRLNHPTPPFSECVEEEDLEWISNKDAFPMVESFVDIIPDHPSIATSNSNFTTTTTTTNDHQSPISVLENSSSSSFNSNLSHGSITNNGNMMMINLSSNFKVPGKARSKHGRKRRRDMLGHPFLCWSVHDKATKKQPSSSFTSKPSSTIGRKCLHCGADKTPQWRAGPLGPKTLCNACGVRYKSGRLCAEYRPASSPSFSIELHSNSHRKIMEMRKHKTPVSGSGLKPAEID